jgi:RNA polymerase sigma-70 factor, ECF subfamily
MAEERLVAALKNQEPAAFEELIDACGDRLLRAAFMLCGNTSDAEDLVQETFLQATRSINRFRAESSLHTWLRAILLNLARRHFRERARIVYDEEAAHQAIAPATEPGSRLDSAVASTAVMRALNGLSEEHREVVVLRYYENMKIHEIAGQLDVSKGTVKSRLHYAVAAMQKLLPPELNLFGANDTEKVDKR